MDLLVLLCPGAEEWLIVPEPLPPVGPGVIDKAEPLVMVRVAVPLVTVIVKVVELING